MEKFSKLKPEGQEIEKKRDVLWKNDHMEIVDFEDWSIIKENDFIICVPYLIESNQVVLRWEYIPTYKMRDGGDHYITVISGSIERGETPERALLRELEEEAGIVVSPEKKIEFLKPLFISKGNSSKYHPCILQLTERDYHEVMAKGDGSMAEKKSRAVKVDAKYINSINANDLITEYMLEQIKRYLNL